MARIYGRDYTKRELCQRVGDLSQIADARRSELSDGKAKGVEAVDVTTGSGFAFTVLPGRGMDLAGASYGGASLGYLSKVGVASPQFFREDGVKGFLDGFFAGLLTTCGLTHMGSPSVDEGRALGLHGVISNTPAEEVSVTRAWVGDEYVLTVRGTVRQASMFGENLALVREISTCLGSKKLTIRDRVENRGFAPQPLMLLYHINIGFPVVDASSTLYGRETAAVARPGTPDAAAAVHRSFQDPTPGYAEQCFYIDHATGPDGLAHACLFNPALGADGLGVSVSYDKSTLPRFTEWKMMGEQEYVVGLEPGTWIVEGRAEARKRGELSVLAPGESRDFHVEIGVVEGREELETRVGGR